MMTGGGEGGSVLANKKRDPIKKPNLMVTVTEPPITSGSEKERGNAIAQNAWDLDNTRNKQTGSKTAQVKGGDKRRRQQNQGEKRTVQIQTRPTT